jgi:hypothetical protein
MPEVNPCVKTAIFPNERDSPRSYIITMKLGSHYHFADSVFSWQLLLPGNWNQASRILLTTSTNEQSFAVRKIHISISSGICL